MTVAADIPTQRRWYLRLRTCCCAQTLSTKPLASCIVVKLSYAVQVYVQRTAEIPRNHSKNIFFYKWNLGVVGRIAGLVGAMRRLACWIGFEAKLLYPSVRSQRCYFCLLSLQFCHGLFQFLLLGALFLQYCFRCFGHEAFVGQFTANA